MLKKYKNDNGLLHREDGPAIEYDDGEKEWYFNEERHRLEGPAVEYIDGSKSWYLNGERHRLEGPAVEWIKSEKEWWILQRKINNISSFLYLFGI